MPFVDSDYGSATSLSARWNTLFILLSCSLASTILLKVGQIQYLELLYGLQMLLLFAAFTRHGWQVTLLRPVGRLLLLYGVFLIASLTLSVAALKRDFYLPEDLSVFKLPVTISIVRGVELLASLTALAYLAHVFSRAESKARFAMRVYFRAGVLSALYGIVSLPLAWLKIADLGVAQGRIRGFYNEGGPYGLYVLSVVFVGLSLHQLRWERKKILYAGFALLAVAFVGSQSKAAVAALLAVGIVNLLLLRSVAQRLAVVAVIVAALVAVSQFLDITRSLRVYRELGLAYERGSHQHKNDPNFVLGRVAGAFIVPRMIAEHPLTGVGWGNYGLVRNAPEYRGASAWVDLNDEPALGVAGLAAELGLPLTALLLLCLLYPAILLRRRRAPAHLVNLALVQPVVHIFGAQLNLTYPWIVTAFALGLAFRTFPAEEPWRSAAMQPNLAYGQ